MPRTHGAALLRHLMESEAFASLSAERRGALEKLLTAGCMTLPEWYLREVAESVGLGAEGSPCP